MFGLVCFDMFCCWLFLRFPSVCVLWIAPRWAFVVCLRCFEAAHAYFFLLRRMLLDAGLFWVVFVQSYASLDVFGVVVSFFLWEQISLCCWSFPRFLFVCFTLYVLVLSPPVMFV